jgi:glycosyl-4,4'-diaponeurosporenoate acyltransferase
MMLAGQVGLVLVDAAVWAGLSVAVGWTANRLPVSRFERDGFLTRLRPAEADGHLYRRVLRIGRWKDRVPEAGAMFAGGVAKGTLATRDPQGLHRFAVETRRAERVHWVLLGGGPLFLLWNPLPLGLAMVAYGLVANLPCILIQRYNRARLQRIGRRREAGPGATRA